MLQIILAILLLIPLLCNAQGTRMSNGAAATSGASILTGIVEEEPPASGEEDLGASGIFACSWEDGSDELNTGASASYVWDSEAGSGTLLSQGTTTGYGFAGDQSKYLLLSGYINTGGYLAKLFADSSSFGIRLPFYLDSGFSSDDSTGALILQTMGSDGTAPSGIQARITRVSGVQTLNIYAFTTAWISMGTYALTEDTWYQLLIKWTKGTSGGATWSLNTESGGEVATGTLSGTTQNLTLDQIRLGILSIPYKSITVRFDALFSQNTYAYPELKAW